MKTNIIYAAIAAAALAIIPTLANAQGHEPEKTYGPRTEVRQTDRRRADPTPAKPDVKPEHHAKPAPDVRPAEPAPAPRHEAPAPEPEPHKGVRVNIPGINININL